MQMKNIIKSLYEDAKNIKEKDPACRNILEVIILYPGFHAILFHRIAHFLYNKNLHFLARLISEKAKRKTGIEIRKKTTYRPWNGSSNRRNINNRR